jgi:phosphoglycolate phosphatase-like HAD superfamily hydrolase
VESVRAVLFDLDGVLVDSYEAWFRVVNAAARQFRKPDVDRDRFAAGWGQGIDADVRQFFPGCKESEIEAFYQDHLLDFASDVKVDPEARDTLVQLRAGELSRGVITNTPTMLARDLLAWVGLIGLVDITVGPDAHLAPKPAPDLVVRACEVLQVQPDEALMVGDSAFDEKAARAARVPFVGYRYASSARSVSRLLDVVRLAESQG